ncbi:hypothetical protein Tsubulata_046986 [Turnera subulata]|uniref:DUF4283 domain-containing protein n=1 Tax=Turnera subulata TaxID=218843 RepID=A0A9Q0G830_9ROSI|nr:hypothetical protein Tsubulata_046986 [Turnera subulata]
MASSSSVCDATGVAREKSVLVIDLGKMLLPNPNASSALKLKGKHASASVPTPVAFTSGVQAAVDDPILSNCGEFLNPPPASVSVAEGSRPPASTIVASTKSNLENPAPPPSKSVVTSDNSWAKVVSNGTRSIPQPLHFVEPVFAYDKYTLCIPSALLDIGYMKYELCLVGQFMGTVPKMGLINAMLNKLWARQGTISVSHYKDTMLLIQFPNADACIVWWSLACRWCSFNSSGLELLTEEIGFIFGCSPGTAHTRGS